MHKVAILLVLYNDENHLKKLISSLLNQSFKDFKIYAIENSIHQKSISTLRNAIPNAFTLPYLGNIGYAKANNILAEKALADGNNYLLVLNTDTLLSMNLIELLLDDLIKNRSIVVSAPIVYRGDYKSGNSTDNIESFGAKCDFNNGKIILRNEINNDDEGINGMSGCCFMIQSAFVFNYGLFNTDNFMYGDELDLCYRIKNNEFKVKLNYNAKIWHFHNFDSNNEFMYFYINRNRFLFFHRYNKYFYMIVAILKEILLFPIRIRWILSKMGKKTIKFYYLGIFFGIMNRRGKINIEFK